MERGFKKRNGRFIKSKGVLMESVQMQDFSFSEICAAAIVQGDNVKGNVIRQKLHDPAELDAGIMEHATMGEELIPLAQRQPMIRPVNFTEEWEKNRRRAGRRGVALDDDDFDFDEAPRPVSAAKPKSGAETVSRAPAAPIAPVAPVAPVAPAARVTSSAAVPMDDMAATLAPDSKGMLNIVSEAYKEEQARVATEKIFRGFDNPLATGATPTPKAERAESQQAAPREGARDFIPIASNVPVDVERDAMSHYRQQLEARMNDEGVIKEIEDEARARGYDDGFRLGEEKGELQMRQATQTMFSRLGEVLGELETLKGAVLDNVQENFGELAHAIAEGLLRREFDIHPEALAEVINRAVKESVESDHFRVLVHPATRDRLATLNIKQLEGRLSADESIPEGDFKIESDLKMVNGRIGVMVTELLRQADARLFEKEKVV